MKLIQHLKIRLSRPKCITCGKRIQLWESYLDIGKFHPLLAGHYCHTECFVFLQAEKTELNISDHEFVKFVVGDKLGIEWVDEMEDWKEGRE